MPSHHETYHPTEYQPPERSWASSEAIRRSMLKCRNRDTSPERLVRSLVHRAGARYRVAARPIPSVRRTADLVFTRQRVAVFVDGCFWHGCADHFVQPATNPTYWADKIATNQRRDRGTDDLLRSAGWEVVRVWEHQPPADAARVILEAIGRS